MRRSTRAAMSMSWVTAITVLPRLRTRSLQDLENLLRALAVEAAGRLVGEDERRIVGERAGDRDALALAARELVRPLVEMIGEAERLEQARARARASRRRGRRPSLRIGQLDVLAAP